MHDCAASSCWTAGGAHLTGGFTQTSQRFEPSRLAETGGSPAVNPSAVLRRVFGLCRSGRRARSLG